MKTVKLHEILKPCPCCSEKSFSDCCYLFLMEKALPQTAEQLMRSRYSAYRQGRLDYIQQTMCDKASEGFDLESAKHVSESTQWIRLKIIDAGQQSESIEYDEVEFEAKYREKGKVYVLHERSQFRRIGGKWFYTGGVFI
jgi:SEC-C motif-containing protein